MIRSNKMRSLGLALITLLCMGTANAELAIIAHPGTKAAGISKDELASLYLDKSKSLPDGTAATPVDQPEGSPARSKFYEQVTGKDERQIKSYWSKRMFTGKGRPPQTLSGDDTVKAYVAKTPGAIGYIDGQSVDGSVKILLILP